MDLSFLFDGPQLVPGEATAALIVTPDGRYLLQHRDDKPGIFFPGWWGNFGGALDAGEMPENALRRELAEELAFHPATVRHFCTIGLDFGFAGYGRRDRHVFEVPITAADVGAMVQREGQGMELVTGVEAMTGRPVIPYDLTAIWQHCTRHRF